MSDEDDLLWWGKPADARRYHVFEGEGLSRSLCDNWMLTHEPVDEVVSPDSDEFREGKDCKTCSRKAGVLSEGE